MVTVKVTKACMDYMMTNHIEPSVWKITKKSLVWYDEDSKRHIVPLSDLEVA